MQGFVDRLWYQKSKLAYLFLPLSAVFYLLSLVRRCYWYKKSPAKLSVPVVVVGNISVGGTGKTPLLVALVQYLQSQGIKPAVISRGYGGTAEYPYLVTAESTAAQSGDEPLLIFRRCQCPVVVAPKRIEAAQFVITHCDVDVILSDDGLQHYALPRDLEILVLDGKRGLGNGFCLPAGPLRETCARIKTVDMVVVNGTTNTSFSANQHIMQIAAAPLLPLNENVLPLSTSDTVHAVAGIGNPERFFTSLRAAGFTIEPHVFADHHAYLEHELQFTDQRAVVMTEKDAVKCLAFTNLNRHWYLSVSAQLPESFWQQFDQQLTPLLQKA